MLLFYLFYIIGFRPSPSLTDISSQMDSFPPFFIWYNALMSFPQTCRRLPSWSIIHLKNQNIFPSFVPGDIIPRFRVSLFAVCSTSVAGRSHPLRQENEGVEPHGLSAVWWGCFICRMFQLFVVFLFGMQTSIDLHSYDYWLLLSLKTSILAGDLSSTTFW